MQQVLCSVECLLVVPNKNLCSGNGAVLYCVVSMFIDCCWKMGVFCCLVSCNAVWPCKKPTLVSFLPLPFYVKISYNQNCWRLVTEGPTMTPKSCRLLISLRRFSVKCKRYACQIYRINTNIVSIIYCSTGFPPQASSQAAGPPPPTPQKSLSPSLALLPCHHQSKPLPNMPSPPYPCHYHSSLFPLPPS